MDTKFGTEIQIDARDCLSTDYALYTSLRDVVDDFAKPDSWDPAYFMCTGNISLNLYH